MTEEPIFLTREIVDRIHVRSLNEYGGIHGVRDDSLVESAIGAAMNDFFYGEGDLYAVAAAYAFHLAQNQAYLDGNKRTATASAMVFLWMNGITHPLDRECRWKIYDALIAIAEHRMTKPELAALFRKFFTTQ
ncbi:MAG: type II toxin-antitoxin system death-on-curing family toxin [Verrucomicrobiaceae bacterium]